ncbi:MAG TPA: hypothetical protein VKY59_07655, partial [Spirillospora sp.]|nr:hypothetical protein [Spirillospora sp.]
MATMDMQAAPARSWRESIRITRAGFFSAVFILAGILILLVAVPQITPGAVTTLVFTPTFSLVIPVAPYMTVVGVLYIIIGVVGLLPGENLKRLQQVLLLIGGLLIFPSVL